MSREAFFDAFRKLMGGSLSQDEVDEMNALLAKLELPGTRTISPAGIDLIKRFEGLKLEAYPDPASGGEPVTIGIGTTIYPSGKKVRLGDVTTEAQAEAYLAHDLGRFEDAVNNLTGGVTTQGQFDALTSFTYNLGAESLRTSTLLRKHNEGDYEGAAREFSRWVFADGKKMNGLVRRRAAEAALYRS